MNEDQKLENKLLVFQLRKYSIHKRLKIPTKTNLQVLLSNLCSTSYLFILLHRDGNDWPNITPFFLDGGIELLVILKAWRQGTFKISLFHLFLRHVTTHSSLVSFSLGALWFQWVVSAFQWKIKFQKSEFFLDWKKY